MSEFTLYCRGESGNAYKAALMLNLVGADWTPRFVNFFDDTTRLAFRKDVNEMGELPTLEVGTGKFISQSGVILTYLSELTGKFGVESEGDRLEALRWLLFDNHKFTPPFATLRFMVGIRGVEESVLTAFLRAQAQSSFEIVDAHLQGRDFMVGSSPTIVDISMVGYLYYDEDARFDRTQFPNIQAWVERIAALPGWKHPYDLMPRAIRQRD